MRIGVISDTHGVIRPEVKTILTDCDCLLHAGDVHTQEAYEVIRHMSASREAAGRAFPIYMVRGNNDGLWALDQPKISRFILEDISFCMVHDRKMLTQVPGGTRVVIFGHSHIYSQEEQDGILWLNPGSCGRRRFRLPLTMAVMTVKEGMIDMERIELQL